MKRFAIPGVICLAFLLATMLPAIAQDDHQDDRNNGARQEERHDQGQTQQDRQQQDRQMQDRQNQNRPDENKQYRQDENRPQQERRDQAARNEHENGRRIDEAHYREHFGRDHHFAIHHIQHINGRDGFAYGGYQFAFGEPWPAGWSYNDNCYIEDVDGQYYLYDLNHPGMRIMLIVL